MSFSFDAYVRPLEVQWLYDMLAEVDRDPYEHEWGGKVNVGPRGAAPGWKGPFNSTWYGHAEWIRQVAHRHGLDAAFIYLAYHIIVNVKDYWLFKELDGHGPNEAVGYVTIAEIPSWVQTAAEKSGIPVDELVHTLPDGTCLVPDPEGWGGSSYGRHHCYDWLCHCLNDDAVTSAMQREGLGDWIPRAHAMIERYVQELLREAEAEGLAFQKAGDRHEWAHYYPQTLHAFSQLYADTELGTKALDLAQAMVWFAIGRNGPGAPNEVTARNGEVLSMWDHGRAGWIWNGYPQYKQLYPWNPWSQTWYHGLRAQAYALMAVDPRVRFDIREEIMFYVREVARWCSNDFNKLPPMVGNRGNALMHGGMLASYTEDSWCRDRSPLTPSQWNELSDSTRVRPWAAMYWHETFDEYETGLSFGSHKGPRLDSTGRGHWSMMADLVALAGKLNGDEELVLQGEWLAHDYVAYFDKNWSHVECEKGDRWIHHWKTAGARDFYWLCRTLMVTRQIF
jgi:hypothetical protein